MWVLDDDDMIINEQAAGNGFDGLLHLTTSLGHYPFAFN